MSLTNRLRVLKPTPRALGWVVPALLSCVLSASAWAHPTRLFLVGVGPGDPDLITLRAIETIKKADLVFCTDGIQDKFSEYLAGKQVVTGYWRLFEYYGADIETLPPGERQRAEELAAKRNEFIARVRQAIDQDKTVVILDNGDPLIYGPWAWCLEEFEDLHPTVVPGVSAFNAGNAAIGRGVTNASETKSVILSANDWPGKTDTIDKLAQLRATMVLFTMRADFNFFIEKLKTHYPPETPVAIVIQAGYKGKEQVIQSTLGKIQQEIVPEQLPFEYMIYVGDFLTFRHKKTSAATATHSHSH
ncbi:MAG: precorrin-4 C(11)-methyltransferase [Thermogutta sp.]